MEDRLYFRALRDLAPFLSPYPYCRRSIHARSESSCDQVSRARAFRNTRRAQELSRRRLSLRRHRTASGSHWLCAKLRSYHSESWEHTVTPLFSAREPLCVLCVLHFVRCDQ